MLVVAHFGITFKINFDHFKIESPLPIVDRKSIESQHKSKHKKNTYKKDNCQFKNPVKQ